MKIFKNKKMILTVVSIFLFLLVTTVISVGIINKNKSAKLRAERTELQLSHPELLIKDVKIGHGKEVEPGDKVTVHYVGMLEDGEIFDNSYDRDREFSFVVGKGRVIPGWEIGIEKMKEGGRRILNIPAELAYGESGVRGMIPANANIIFEIELIEVFR